MARHPGVRGLHTYMRTKTPAHKPGFACIHTYMRTDTIHTYYPRSSSIRTSTRVARPGATQRRAS